MLVREVSGCRRATTISPWRRYGDDLPQLLAIVDDEPPRSS